MKENIEDLKRRIEELTYSYHYEKAERIQYERLLLNAIHELACVNGHIKAEAELEEERAYRAGQEGRDE